VFPILAEKTIATFESNLEGKFPWLLDFKDPKCELSNAIQLFQDPQTRKSIPDVLSAYVTLQDFIGLRKALILKLRKTCEELAQTYAPESCNETILSTRNANSNSQLLHAEKYADLAAESCDETFLSTWKDDSQLLHAVFLASDRRPPGMTSENSR
jgi:hypothetical protein